MKTNLFCPNCFQSDCFNGRLCYQCGYEQKAAVDSRAMRAGVLLKNRYFLGRVLGIGGFGITYLAFDSRLRQRCAVKEYFPSISDIVPCVVPLRTTLAPGSDSDVFASVIVPVIVMLCAKAVPQHNTSIIKILKSLICFIIDNLRTLVVFNFIK